MIESHASSNGKLTYAYYFTEILQLSDEYARNELPKGFVRSADHAHEVAFVFGGPFIANNTEVFKGIMCSIRSSSIELSI